MPKQDKNWLKTTRIETLTDGIYAITMTLLVITLAIPRSSGGGSEELLKEYLRQDWPDLINFAKSFLLLATFWILHHRQFNIFKRMDETFLWLNIFLLMFVALVPFSTSVEGEFANVQLAAMIFHSNLLVIGLFSYGMTFYSMHNHKLISREEVSTEQIARAKKRGLVMPGTALLAIGLSFISPAWSSLAYILIPLLLHRIGR